MSAPRFVGWLALSALIGCADYDLASKDEYTDAAAPEDFQDGTLRLDVTPPSGITTPELQSQTFLVMPPRYTGLEAELRPTVTLFGLLQAEVAHPWSAAGVPTEIVPFQGVIAAEVANSLESGKAGADELGAFSLPLVADNFYDLTIIPDDASASPLVVYSGLDLLADQDLTQTLPTGIPVYGRVADAEGNAVSGVGLRIYRTDGTNSTPSAVVETDRSGWYTLRVADPGSYAVEVIGEQISNRTLVPSLTLPVDVVDEAGTDLDVDLGVLGRASVTGSLGDAGEDRDIEQAVIRAVSTSLDGSGGSLVIETTSVNEGFFTLDLLPGAYTVSVIPDYTPNPDASPISVVVEVDDGDVSDLGRITLPGLGSLSGVVVDQSGDPVGGAQVKATQTGYGRHSYNALTDADGSYQLDLPVTPYEVTVTPVGTAGAVTRRNLTPGQNGNITLDVGQPVAGTLLWQGQPVPYAKVEVRDLQSGALLGVTSSGTDGAFALEVVVPVTDGTASSDSGDTDSGGTTTGPTDTGGTDTGATETGTNDTGDTAAR